MTTKTCTRCNVSYPATSGYFWRLARNLDGLRNQCKWCLSQRDDKPAVPLSPADRGDASEDAPQARSAFKAAPAANDRADKLRPPAGVQRVLIVGDLHIPEHDVKAWNALLAWLGDYHVDRVILNGDFLELASCSQHPGTDFIALDEDFRAGEEALRELRAVCPDSAITLLEGNHETRLTRIAASKLPQFAGSISVPAGLHLDDYEVDWVGEKEQPIVLGDLDVLHGHQFLGEGNVKKYHAASAVEIYGEPGHTVLYGHTHKCQVYDHPSKKGVERGIALGCMRTLDPDWLHGRKAGWVVQFAVAYVHQNGHTEVVVVNVTNGQFVWDGTLYG